MPVRGLHVERSDLLMQPERAGVDKTRHFARKADRMKTHVTMEQDHG